jgi:hypothetical protein
MRRVVVATLLATAALHLPDPSPQAAKADIAFVQASGFDRACAALRGRPIAAAWRDELQARSGELEAAWEADAEPVLKRALQLSGARLNRDQTVRLTLCDLPSSSWLGPQVNMRYALASFADRPVSLRYKAVTATHEVLHPVLAEVDLSDSPSLAAHRREPRRVRDHLHLFALLKASMLDLGREDLLAEVVAADSALPNPAYSRAWSIVNSRPDDYARYVRELRTRAAPP